MTPRSPWWVRTARRIHRARAPSGDGVHGEHRRIGRRSGCVEGGPVKASDDHWRLWDEIARKLAHKHRPIFVAAIRLLDAMLITIEAL
jgi:hypothetical protein